MKILSSFTYLHVILKISFKKVYKMLLETDVRVKCKLFLINIIIKIFGNKMKAWTTIKVPLL